MLKLESLELLDLCHTQVSDAAKDSLLQAWPYAAIYQSIEMFQQLIVDCLFWKEILNPSRTGTLMIGWINWYAGEIL
jgi:hypothetical protein